MIYARITCPLTIAPTPLHATVEGWVHIQAEVDHELDSVAETAWVESLAGDASASGLPGPLACVVYADLRSANVREVLSRQCRHPLTRGVRQEVWFDPASTRADIPREDLLSDPAWQEGYRALAEFGLSFDLLVWPAQLPQAAAIAADVPAVPVVLEHLGLPDPTNDPGLRTWRTGVRHWLNSRTPASSCRRSAGSAIRATNRPCALSRVSSLSSSARSGAWSGATSRSSVWPVISARSTDWFSPPCGICPMSNVQTSSPAPHGAFIG